MTPKILANITNHGKSTSLYYVLEEKHLNAQIGVPSRKEWGERVTNRCVCGGVGVGRRVEERIEVHTIDPFTL